MDTKLFFNCVFKISTLLIDLLEVKPLTEFLCFSWILFTNNLFPVLRVTFPKKHHPFFTKLQVPYDTGLFDSGDVAATQITTPKAILFTKSAKL